MASEAFAEAGLASGMRILQIHNFYQQSGGEDRVYQAECELLRSRGHAVVQYSLHNDSLSDMAAPEMAVRTIWNHRAYRELKALLQAGPVDVMHAHNTFPLMSPAVYYAAQAFNVPVVQTLHNYRLFCAGSTFYRGGRVCEDCLHSPLPYPGVMHACYRNSRPATTAVAAMLTVHRAAGTWRTKVQMYIALTRFAKQKLIEGGLPEHRVRVKPNFLASDPGPGTGLGGFALFLGRLTEEKGIRTLLRAWRDVPDVPLKVAGSGPLASFVAERARELPSVEYLGQCEPRCAIELLHAAAFLVFPSEWYEGLPMTIVEAFACGTPVICSALGAMNELVLRDITGVLFEPGNALELAGAVNRLIADPRRLSQIRAKARQEYLECYTPGINYPQLMEIYEAAKDNLHS
ncbi:MAG: glycosyltransferase family 4 protein [Acidobacteriaceae bacterium]|nr:glycosyltransferase family 4 protein [Acidobacteriaceae bacterium]